MFRLEGGVIVLEIGLRVKSCKVYELVPLNMELVPLNMELVPLNMELVPLNMFIHIKRCKQWCRGKVSLKDLIIILISS